MGMFQQAQPWRLPCPEFYYFPTAASVAAADVIAQARAGLAQLPSPWDVGLDPSALTIDAAPATIDRDALLACLPAEARAATSRYWDVCAGELTEPAQQMLPSATSAVARTPSVRVPVRRLARPPGPHLVGVRERYWSDSSRYSLAGPSTAWDGCNLPRRGQPDEPTTLPWCRSATSDSRSSRTPRH